ncbi:MAG: hypothetical protein J7K33_12550 [Candidatus Marinimicrobia bacterium]|nr:hypothetical protein [Candidatus Neomarinimicrobiota bacterium]
MKRLLLLLFTLALVLNGEHIPSKERGDPNYRRQTDIDGNKVRTSVFNYGLTGRPEAGPSYVPYEWPKNSGKHYIAMTQLWVGAEVYDVDSNLIHIVDVANGRLSTSGESWNFEPVPGYLNKESDLIAKSDEPESWPPFWPDKMDDESDPGWAGSWNGYFGKNQFNADQEIYFRISDDRYTKYRYYPDDTDSTRGGLGLLADMRVMEWSQVLIEDVVFILHEIKNDGTKDLDKVSFCLWLADLVGGDGDSNDDSPDFDLIYDIAWSKDSDGIGNTAFGTDPVGVAATAFLETPGNSKDRIDNDGDGELNSPIVSLDMIVGELHNRVDDNGNGLIDEDSTHVPFGNQRGVGYADGIDNNMDGEDESPVVTQEMVNACANDPWHRWPPNPENDDVQEGKIHLIMVEQNDIGLKFADNIDNDGDGEDGSPVVTIEMVTQAANDKYRRFKTETGIILYDLDSSDVGMRYADGIDNDGDGAIDEGIDEDIDEMIDESREDGIDNDKDWNPYYDDIGLDGSEFTGDTGEGDGIPTSGAGTTFPGEPNIDKTDVSESDQMGLTAVAYDRAGSINLSSDDGLWLFYMTPGSFWQPPPGGVTGDYDLFVSSGYFPLKAGQTERISMAICLGENEEDAIRNKDIAQKTYDEDYQFAKQPIPPTVTAVAGDRKVTLYWDDASERSFDKYMYGIGAPGYDFEGYKIYRATDWEFKDALEITDAQGNLTFMKPIAQFDLKDGIKGYHPVAVNGVHYYLGDDTGLQHTFVDSNVQNGQTYYYAVVAYDFGGDLTNNIPPTESTIKISVDQVTGEIKMGPNVVAVTPEAPAAGYIPGNIKEVKHIKGFTTSKIKYRIVDPLAIKDSHTYRITFEDTTKPKKGGLLTPGYDTLTTKSFTLVDVTNPAYPETLINKSRKLSRTDEQPVIHGFQLIMDNKEVLEMNREESHWNRDSLWQFVATVFSLSYTMGRPYPADYRIEIGEPGMRMSTEYVGFPSSVVNYPSVPVNFTVKKRVATTGIDSIDWKEIPFAFGDYYPKDAPDGLLNAGPDSPDPDWVIFLDDTTEDGKPAPTWRFSLDYPKLTETHYIYQPQPGDTAFIIIDKPFLSGDIFEFTTYSAHIDTIKAKEELKNIKVVPNPYFAAATWEPKNPYTSGRGPRSIHFIHLPAKCTIRIYTISGELVKVIKHDAPYNNGTEEWNLLTEDNLSASYGVYIYHVEAPGIGEHVGKFAIIK